MTKTRVTEFQSVLLAHAAKRDDGSLLPAPTALADQATKVRTALGQLLKRALAVETKRPTKGAEWRRDGEEAFGLAITDLGCSAIGLVPDGDADTAPAVSSPDAPSASDPVPSHDAKPPVVPTKTSTVIALLSRKQGATLAEMVEATSWLPHTTRAALTGLRKKGHTLVKSQRDDATCYTIVAGA